MRSSRLIALMMELGRESSTTVGALAQRHGVSERTIQRDLQALGELGAPVWTQPGPSGGVGLVQGWRSPLTGMTATELQALLMGEAGATDLGLEADLETARLKMLATRTPAAEAGESTMERFYVDHGRWFVEPQKPRALPVVAKGVWSGKRLHIRYRRPRREPSRVQRLVDPLGLVLKADQWYLVATHRGQVRTYRVSRIDNAALHEEDAHRPQGFVLSQYWAESRAAFESGVYSLRVQLSVPSTEIQALRSALPGVDVDQAVGNAKQMGDRWELDLQTEKLEIVAHQLLGVPGVSVIEPPELRQRLHERGLELIDRNSPPESP